jgi:hypothetical protein
MARPSRIYYLYVLVFGCGVGGFWLARGEVPSISAGAVLVGLLLLFGLARGSTLAWALLLAWHGFTLLVALALTQWPWSASTVVLIAASAVAAAILISGEMRRTVHRLPGHSAVG